MKIHSDIKNRLCRGGWTLKSPSLVSSLAVAIGLYFATMGSGYGQLPIAGADGSDGAFAPSGATVVIDLAQAGTGAWDGPSTTAGKGVYDASRRAVVFKYSSVNIPAGTEVKFKNRAGYPPVVWLVTGDVTINGSVNLNGENSKNNSSLVTEPGPGGFRGGAGSENPFSNGSGGFGPGGGKNDSFNTWIVGGGSYASLGIGEFPGSTYGNSKILPLLGGSGGGGSSLGNDVYSSGGGGGGAILIAARGQIIISGGIYANGGLSDRAAGGSGGSGGAVRIIAAKVAGSGTIEAQGKGYYVPGGNGRVRIETPDFSGGLTIFPATISVLPDNPPMLWLPTEAPTLRVVSVNNVSVPLDPKSSLGAGGADVALTNVTNIVVQLEGRNLAMDSVVNIRVVPLSGFPVSTNATFVSGNLNASVWRAEMSIPKGFCAIQARAVIP